MKPEFAEVFAGNVRLIEPIDDFPPADAAGFVENAQTCNKAELLPEFGALTQLRPGAFRG